MEDPSKASAFTLKEVEDELRIVDPEKYRMKLQTAEREYRNYLRNKQELCNDLMLHLDKPLRAAVTQHADYRAAKDDDKVIDLWTIVVECATGKGAHSVYVSMMRFLNLKMKGPSAADYTEYIKRYNDTVADVTRIGTEKEIITSLYNAKFIEGLHAETFSDKIKQIMGSPVWPDYKDLQRELTRYVNATKGFAGSMLRKDNPDGVLVSAGKVEVKGACYNCGISNHRAAECRKPKHQCTICGNRGHLEDYCLNNPSNKRNERGYTQVNVKAISNEGNDKRQASAYDKRKSAAKPTQGKFTRSDRKKVLRAVKIKRASVNDDDEENDNEEEEFLLEVDDTFYDDENEDIEELNSRRNVINIEEDDDNNNETHNNNTELYCCNRTQVDNKLSLFAVDSGCVGGGHVVKDNDLLTETKKARVSVQGYDGQQTLADQIGTVPGIGRAVLVKGAPNNLLNLRKLCRDIGGHYEGDGEHMMIYDKKGDLFAKAIDHGDGFLSFDYKQVAEKLKVRAIYQGAPHFTAEETVRAKEAYELCGKMGHPGYAALQTALDAGAYGPTHLTSQDVRNGRNIFGKCIPCLEAKMKKPKEPSSNTPPAKHVGERLFVDLIQYADAKKTPAIGGFIGAVFSVDEKSGFVSVCGIRSKQEVLDALQTIVAVFNSQRHAVRQIVSDDESSFTAHITALARLGIQLTSTPAGLHNKRVERYIQTFKNRREAMLASLPYQLPEGKLEHELALAVARGMNATCNTVSGKRSPYELFSGRKPMLPKHVFGQPGICYNPNPANRGSHGQWCIYLGQRDHEHHNNLRVFVPSTGTVCSRLRFEPTNTYPMEWGYKARLQPRVVMRGSNGAQNPPVTLPPPQPERTWQPRANLPEAVLNNNAIQAGGEQPQLPPPVVMDRTEYEVNNVPTDTNHTIVPHLPTLSSPSPPAAVPSGS
ncbi:MAG TPA: hypothetical protein PLL95_02580, partial [Anaerolineales bacterium]|nr:hypothetical protein [Anaerolineales bacterium]